MAHIGFFCPPIPGHLNAVATLGRSLARRGHRTTAFQIPEARIAIEAQQLEFCPLGEGRSDTRTIADAVKRLGTLTGLSALKFSVHCAVSLADTVCQYAPAAIETAGIDLLVVDQNEPAGASVAQHLKLPFVNVMSGLPLNREPKMPPPFVPWAYNGRMTTTLFNTAAYAAFDRLVAPVNRVLNQHRRMWNLSPIHRPDDTFSELAQLSQLTEDFDFPRVSKPAALHYLGPFRDGGRPPVPFPFERLNGQPLVYASFGTLVNRKAGSFRVIAEACADLDVQLVISAGGGCAMDATQFAGLPIVVEYAPQLELLERAAVCINHGGLNTVMESLSCGVPMVTLPITNDNPAVAARIRRVGAGEVISLARFSASRLRDAVRRVLEVPEYQRRAHQLKMSIQRAGGVERAADIVEDAVDRAASTDAELRRLRAAQAETLS
jgi:zeaxanthin glucosyltransferase